MAEFMVRGQSYKWSAYTINLPGNSQDWVGHARVEIRKDGNMTYIDVILDPSAPLVAVMPVHYSGNIAKSKHSEGELLLAISSSGSWSGGSNYSGWLVGRIGARAFFSCKGNKEYYHFVDKAKGWEETGPIKSSLEVQTI